MHLLSEHYDEMNSTGAFIMVEDISGDKEKGVAVIIDYLEEEIDSIEQAIFVESQRGAADRIRMGQMTAVKEAFATLQDVFGNILYLDHKHDPVPVELPPVVVVPESEPTKVVEVPNAAPGISVPSAPPEMPTARRGRPPQVKKVALEEDES